MNKVAISKGYPDWETMENWIIDNNLPQNIATILVSAMREVAELFVNEKQMESPVFENLKVGDTIMLNSSGETFTIDKIFPDRYVDMTATKPYNKEFLDGYKEKLHSIFIVNYKIVK